MRSNPSQAPLPFSCIPLESSDPVVEPQQGDGRPLVMHRPPRNALKRSRKEHAIANRPAECRQKSLIANTNTSIKGYVHEKSIWASRDYPSRQPQLDAAMLRN